MKKYAYIFLFFSLLLTAAAQTSIDKKEAEIFTITETAAEFPGGISEMMKFIQSNLKYPENARTQKLGGKVFLKFVVNETGAIDNIEVIKSTGNTEMDEEAERVVKMMPIWKPATMTGKTVKCYFNLPLNFSMNEPYYMNNVFNKDGQYKKLTRLIFDDKADEAFVMLNSLTPAASDADFMYNKAVLLYYSHKDQETCQLFKSVVDLGDSQSNTYKNSNKFYKQYCN